MPEQTHQPQPQSDSTQADTTQAATAAAEPQARPVWLVEHPTHQYAEDVKALARQHGLQVVDAAVASAADVERATAFPPTLTLRSAEVQSSKSATPPPGGKAKTPAAK